MFATLYNKVTRGGRRLAAFIALLALTTSSLVALEPPPPAAAAIVSNNLALNLDASNTSSLAASGSTGWNSVSPASSTATSTFFGNASRTSDATGASLILDGAGDAAVFPAGTGRSAGSMTVETWIKPGNLRVGWNILATRWFTDTGRSDSVSSQDWHLGIYGTASTNLKLQLNTGAGILTSNTVFPTTSANKWYHLAFTIDAANNNTATMWVNGVADGSIANFPHTDNAVAQLHVGDVGPTTALNGNMSRFRIYNSALTAAQMAQNYLTDSARYGYAPTNTVAPSTSGIAKVGVALTANVGTWGLGDADGTTTAYQWQTSTDATNWTNISGATASTYTPVAGDATNFLRVSVTKTNTAGSATATSATTLRVQTASGTALVSGGTLTGLTSTVPNDATTYNVTLASNNLSATMRLGTTTGLTLISGYASTASFMASTIGASAPIISFRGTGTAINTALANVIYTSATQQTDVVKLYYATAGTTSTDTKDYIPIYDNGLLKFHYYAYKVHASGKNRADMDAALVGLGPTDNVQAPGPWYLSTPRYQVEWERIKLIVGQNQAFMGARADAGSSTWYWPANTDGYSSATIFGTQSGSTVTATSNIYNQTNTTLPYHTGEPNAGTTIGRSGFFYISNSQLGWDDIPLDASGVTSFTMETYGTAPFNTGSTGTLTQTVSVVASHADAPTGVTGGAAGTSSIAVGWNLTTANTTGVSITGYRVEASTTSNFTTVVPATTVSTNRSLLVSGLAANTLYYLRVMAMTSAGNGAASSSITVTTASAATTITVVSSGGGTEGTDYSLINGFFVPKSGLSVTINASAIETALGLTAVTLAADNVVVNAPIAWNVYFSLMLGNSTTSTVAINSTITANSGSAWIYVTPSTYSLDVKSGASIRFPNAASGNRFYLGGNMHTVLKTEADLATIVAGSRYAIGKPITLANTYTSSPIPLAFTGTLDGLGNTIDSMKLNPATAGSFGLIQTLSAGTIRNLGVTNISSTVSNTSGTANVGAIVGQSTGGTLDQVWSTGFLSTASATAMGGVSLGGLIGNTSAGTTSITKSWSSVNLDTSRSTSFTTMMAVGALIGSDVSTPGQLATASGGTITMSQVYSTGGLNTLASNVYRGHGGLMGLHYSTATVSITDAFNWANHVTTETSGVGGLVANADGGAVTLTNAYTVHPLVTWVSGKTTNTNVQTSVVAGASVSAQTGTNWSTDATNGTYLKNVAKPYRNLYVQVVAPTNGAYSGMTTQVVDGSSQVQTLSSLNLSSSGTPVYSILSNAAKATYNVSYVSGLTLGGSAVGLYTIGSWPFTTSVTISRLSQTFTWTPNTSISFGTGSFTPSAAPVSSASSTISYAVTSAGTTGCTVNGSTGVVTYTSSGSCEVTATAAQTTDFTSATVSRTFVIGEASTAPTVTATGGNTSSVALSWTTPTVNASTSITGYQILYSTSSSMTSATTISTGNTDTRRLITGLTAGTTYYFQVRAVNGTTWYGSVNATPASAAPKAASTTITVVSTGAGTLGTDYFIVGGVLYTTNATANVNVTDIQNALLTGGVSIAAENVIVNAPIAWSTSQVLTLGNTSGGSVSLNESITASGVSGGLVISPTSYSLKVNTGAKILLSGASTTLSIGGNSYTLIRNEAGLATVAATGNYALAAPMVLTSAYTTAPINVTLAGTLDGLGNSIDSMKIGATTSERIGLINTLATGGIVRNLGVTNAVITLSNSNYRVGVISGGSTGGTIDQVWSTGFIRTTTTNTWLALGGLVGNAESGTLNISKSWSSVNIDSSTSGSATKLEQGGIIGGDELTVGQSYTLSGGSINLSQVYATGTLKWASNSHRGIGGLMGLKYSTGTTTMTDAFSWVTFATGMPSNNNAGIVGVAAGGTTTLTRTYQTTSSLCVATVEPGFTATPNCDTKRTPGETVAGISGANWAATGPSTLINLATPTRPIYVQVIAPTDGSFSTISYQIVDAFGVVQNASSLSAMNLSVSGTPVYKAAGVVLNSASAKATYASYYDSGLTLGGTASGTYSLGAWRDTTSVTISKFPQTVTWTPTTSVGFGSGTFTPSPAPVASGGTTITYSVSSAGTTGCTVNTSTGAITYTRGGSCAITATAANAGDYLSANDTETFVIAEPATAPTGLAATTAGSGMLNIGWTAPTVSASSAITGYTLTYSTNSGMASPTTINVGNTTGYLLTGLTPGTVYYFQVRAVSGSTWTGPLSTIGSATPNSTATTINVVASGGGTAGTDFTINGGVISATGTANINASVIASALGAEAAVQLAATNVNVNAAISWSANSVLTLGNTSAAAVNVNSTITGSGNTAGVRILPSTYGLSVKNGSYIRLTGTTPSFVLGSTTYTVVNTVAGLANIAAGTTWALTAPITLTSTYSAAVRDFTFTGIMDGLGNTINNMNIAYTTSNNFGFFNALNGATIRNAGFTNVNISSSTGALEQRVGSIAGNGCLGGTCTVSQVWATGFISQNATTGTAEVGGFFGGATAGTLDISKSWSSVSISTSVPNVGSGGIIGANVPTYRGTATPDSTFNSLTITESYSVGNILRDLPVTGVQWYGNGGIIGVAYGYRATITNSFTWGTVNATGANSSPMTSTGGVVGVSHSIGGTSVTTLNTVYTTSATCVGTGTTGCTVSAVAGAAVSGFSTGVWSTTNGASLANVAPPTKLLYVRVKVPTDGSFGTVGTEIVDSTGTVQTLSTLNLSVSGTPVFDTISASSAIGTYSAKYASGLTLGGSSASVYSLGAWMNSTSVTISKLAQTVTWSPTTNYNFGNGSITPSTSPVASGGTAITYSVTSAGTTGCSVNSTLGLITYLSAGTCEVTATAAASGNYLAASRAVSFVIAAAPTITVVSTGGGTPGTDFVLSGGVLSASANVSVNASYLTSELALGNVTLAGNVIVSAPVTWSGNYVLTLGGTSTNTVAVNASISGSGNTAGLIIKPNTYSLSTKTGAAISLTGTTPTLSIGGNSYTLIKAIADLSTVTASAGTFWALAKPLTYSTTIDRPAINIAFAGTFDGLGNTVDNMRLTSTANLGAAFIKNLNGGTVRNLGVTNSIIALEPTVTTNSLNAGGLVGDSAGGTLDQVWTTGFLRVKPGSTYANLSTGGLVGDVYAGSLTINKSWSSVNLYGWASTFTNVVSGGLVGGTLANWTATGTTLGGGLVITQSYATGDIAYPLTTGIHGYGGIVGVHLGSSVVSLTDVFSWSLISINTGAKYGGIFGNATGSTAGLQNAWTVTNQLSPSGSAVTALSNASFNYAIGGSPLFTTNANWYESVNGRQLVNLPMAAKNFYVNVYAPTDGSYGTISYAVINGVQSVRTLAGYGIAVSGTPTYSIASDAVISATPYQVTYVSGLTFTGTGTLYSITPYPFATAVTISKYAQSISLGTTAPTTASVGSTYTPTATATSALSVVFTIDSASSSVCTIASGVVTFIAIGDCVINANQAGNTSYLAATQVQQTATATAKGAQTVSFSSTAPSAKVSGSTYTPTGSSTSGLNPAITVDSGSSAICSIASGVVSFAAVGNCVLNINQAGNANWNPASQSQQTVVVAKGDQTITFSSTAPTSAVVAGTTYTPAATSTSSGVVAFTIDGASSAVCSITSGVVSFQTAGTCRVNANQAGNVNWNAATQNFQTFTVGKGTTSLSFTSTASNPKVNTTYTPAAASAGTGAVTYTIDGTSSSICSIAAGVVTFNAVGTCKVNANQATDANYLAAAANPQTITVVKGDQTITFSTTAPTSAVVAGTTYTPAATSTSTGVVAFTIDGASSAVCSIAAGVVSFQTAGTCRVNANQAGNVNWNAATQNFQTFTVGKGTTALAFTSTAANPKVNTTYTPVAASSGTGTVTYTIDGTSSSICSISAGVVTFNAVGTCKVNASQATDANYLAATANPQTITVVKGDQTITFSSIAPLAAVVSGTSYTPTATSTSGGAVSFTIDGASAAVCSITTGSVTFQSAGTCKVLANQAGNANWNAAPQNFQTFTVGQGTPTLEFTSNATSPKVNSTYSPVASSSSSGTVSYVIDDTSSSVCSIAAGVVSFLAVGTCKVNASQIADTNWLSVTKVQQTITVVQGDQTIAFSTNAPASAVVTGATYTPAATSTSGGAVAFTIDNASSNVCSITAGVVSFLAVGTCKVLGNQAGNTNWAAATENFQSFEVGKGAQVVSFTTTSPVDAAVDGTTYTVAATGGATNEAVVFTIDATATEICSISGTDVSFLAAGTCKVNANQAGDANYEAAPQVQQVFTVGKGAQVVAFTSSVPNGVRVGDSGYTPTASGGSATSPVEISVAAESSTKCSITAGEVSFLAAGDCVLEVTQAGDANYEAAQTVTQTIAIAKGLQTITQTNSVPALAFVGMGTFTPTFSGGPSGNAVTLEISPGNTSVCSVENGVITITGAGLCRYLVNQVGDDNYEAATEFVEGFMVDKGTQVISISSNAPSDAVVGGATFTPAATGGPTGHPVVFRVDDSSVSVCSISAGVVRFVGVGTCLIGATQSGDSNYESASDSISFEVAKGAQAITFTSAAPTTAVVGGAQYSPAATGGATANNVVFQIAAASSSICTLTAGKISFQSPGDCVIEANQAGNTNYNAAPLQTQTIAVGKGAQVLTFVSSAPSAARVGGTTYQPVVTGGPSTSSVAFSIASAAASVCSVSNGVVSFTGVGDCVIQANQDGDSNYNAANQLTQTVSVAKGIQVVSFTSTPPSLRPVQGTTYTPTASSGASGIGVVFTIAAEASSLCSISNGVISFQAVGDCVVYANQAGNANWNAAPQVSQVFDITKGEQIVTITSSAPTDAVVGGTAYQPTAAGGAGTKAVTFSISALSADICSATDGSISFQAAGECLVVANQAGDANYNAATPVVQSINVGKGSQSVAFSSIFLAAQVEGTAYRPTANTGASVSPAKFTIASLSSAICEIVSGTVYFHAVGDCVIELNQDGDANYNPAAGVTQVISVAKGVQLPLVAQTSLESLSLGDTPPTTVIGVTGGSGTGAVTWTISPASAAICSLSGDVVTGLSVGYCDLVATKAADDNFLEETAELAILVATGGQTPVRTSVNVTNPVYEPGLELTLSLDGGNGNGAIWFESTTPEVCTVTETGTVSVLKGGSCSVIGHKAGDENFIAAQDALTFTISRADQGAVNIALDRTLTYSPEGAVTGSLSVSGAKSSSSPIFSMVSGTCEISGTELSATQAGACVVSVSVGQDQSYLAKTVEKTFTIAKAVPSALTATVVPGEPNAIAWRGKSVTHFNVVGGSGSGTISASTTTANICTVSLTASVIEVTGLAQGTCVVSMNQAADANYQLRQSTFNVSVLDLPSVPQNFTVNNTGANQDGSMAISVSWAAPATAATRAAVSGYEVQSKTGNGNWATVPNGDLDAAATSLTVTVPPWSQVFFRVAPKSALDASNGSNRNWITLTQGGTNVEVPFDVTGTLATISTNLAATTSGETVTLTGTGFDSSITTRVQLSTASPVFASGFGRAALAQTVVVPATVVSPTEIRFTLPKITLPAGRTSLATQVRILTANGISSQPVSLEYIPKKLAQTLALVGLPATKGTITIGGAAVRGTTTVAVVGNPARTGATPVVTATPDSVCTASVVNNAVTVVPVGRGVCAISVVAPATPGFTASAAKTYSYTVKGATQSLTFANPGAKTFSNSLQVLTALSSALLPVAFSTTTPKTCAIVENALQMIAAGPCSIVANQAGSSTVEAAVKVTQTFAIAKASRTAGLTATADSVSATGERTSQTYDVTSALAAPPVTVFVGENPLDVPVLLNKREGTLVFTVETSAEKAGICSAEAGEAGTLLASITMLDIGTCKVTISQPDDASWNAGSEIIVITVVGSALPDGSVDPAAANIGDAALAPEDTDTTPGDVDTEPAVALNLDPTASKSYSFGGEDGFAYDPASGKINVKTRSVLVGTWTAILKSPSADKKWFKIKGKVVKKVQTYVNVASCTTKLTVKKDPKLKKKVSRVIGAGCLLSDEGKAAFTAVGIQKIKMKYKRIRQYANTGLDYRGTAKAKTRILKKVNRTVVIKVGRTN